MSSSWDKLTVVVRSDLTAGQQLAQALHAGLAFAREHPTLCHEWMDRSNTVAVVQAPEIEPILHRALGMGVTLSEFREPDRDNQLTAVALAPSEETKRLTRRYPLAG